MHAFVDESARPGVYLLAAAIVDPAELRRLRTAMRGLLLPGQREVHMQKEREQRRGVLVDRVVAAGAGVRIYFADHSPRGHHGARDVCLAQLSADLVRTAAHRLVLDARTPGQDKHDEFIVRRAIGAHPRVQGLTYEHVESSLEPLIWTADVLGWAFGAGGHWRRRAMPAVLEVTDCASAT